ncbi:MAG TPA: hypothetical protein VFV96_05395 [Verrucomicrobiae bacterium]|nr:hypothetical protein [Verrucomicrobiae bacterium]
MIYLHLPRVEKVILLFLYTKSRQSDLSADQRFRLRLLARQIEQAYAAQNKK